MAEILAVMFGGGLIPQVLQASWTLLKKAYDIYASVKNRREQIKILLDRCSRLLSEIASHLQKDPLVAQRISSQISYVEKYV